MRLAIINLTSGGLSGGYRKYLQQLIPLLRAHPQIKELSVFIPPGMGNILDDKGINIQVLPVNDSRHRFPWLTKKVKMIAPDVLFIPSARFGYFRQIPTVAMVRNMEPLEVPFSGNPPLEMIKNICRAYVARKACKSATRIIAVSEHVKTFLSDRWKFDPDRIGVVYHGVESAGMTTNLDPPASLKEFEHNQFCFTAGSIRPARGLEDLIIALGLLGDKTDGLKLVIGGAVDPGMEEYKSKIDRMISSFRIDSKVIWAGRLTEREMAWCYDKCQAFVMTSRTEACPNVVLEAMAHGCVCISTETPPMPEFFRETAVYYPPKDGKALCNALQLILSWGDKKRLAVSERAKKRASQFSWYICADRTLKELRLAIENFALRGIKKQ